MPTVKPQTQWYPHKYRGMKVEAIMLDGEVREGMLRSYSTEGFLVDYADGYSAKQGIAARVFLIEKNGDLTELYAE